MDSRSPIRVGSRKSELALIQTKFVIAQLKALHPDKTFEIVTMNTVGDKILNIALPKIGEKSLFTKELETALNTGGVDFVVHSLKDLPTVLPDGLAIGAVLARDDPRDAVVFLESHKNYTLETLPAGSVIGTSSLRRTAQLAKKYPHLKVQNIRGNLNTRLKKLDELGMFQGIILAAAGLYRMNWQHRISQILEDDDILYAIGQGALAVECRQDDERILALLSSLYDRTTAIRIVAERSFLKTLGGGCSAPVATISRLVPIEKDRLKIDLTGAVWSLDGLEEITDSESCYVESFKDVEVPSKNNITNDETDKEISTKCKKRKSCPHNKTSDLEIKKQKLNSENSLNSATNNNLLLVDPHEHCPVHLPVGDDFMGQCPYLEVAGSSTTPTNPNLLVEFHHPKLDEGGSGDATKCPFFKEASSNNGLVVNTKIGPAGDAPVAIKLFTGLVKHPDLPEDTFDAAETLGKILAEKLVKRGAETVMHKAQAIIRGAS